MAQTDMIALGIVRRKSVVAVFFNLKGEVVINAIENVRVIFFSRHSIYRNAQAFGGALVNLAIIRRQRWQRILQFYTCPVDRSNLCSRFRRGVLPAAPEVKGSHADHHYHSNSRDNHADAFPVAQLAFRLCGGSRTRPRFCAAFGAKLALKLLAALAAFGLAILKNFCAAFRAELAFEFLAALLAFHRIGFRSSMRFIALGNFRTAFGAKSAFEFLTASLALYQLNFFELCAAFRAKFYPPPPENFLATLVTLHIFSLLW